MEYFLKERAPFRVWYVLTQGRWLEWICSSPHLDHCTNYRSLKKEQFFPKKFPLIEWRNSVYVLMNICHRRSTNPVLWLHDEYTFFWWDSTWGCKEARHPPSSLRLLLFFFPEPPAEATVMLAGKSRVRLLTYYIIVTQAPLN